MQQLFQGDQTSRSLTAFLENFLATWKYHHKLEPDQLGYAEREAAVKEIGYYHGGDVLYKLGKIPGIWHQACLRPLPGQSYATEVLAFKPAPVKLKRSMKLHRRRKFIFVAVLIFVLLVFVALVITLLPGIEALIKGAG